MSTESPRKELRLGATDFSGLMGSVLERGASFRFRASGFSMSPLIRDRDVVTIARCPAHRLRPGDVAAVTAETGALLVHRIVAVTGAGFLFKGDNCTTPDGVFARTAIIGLVTSVERNGRKVRFGGGPAGRLVAFLSRSGLLNSAILPLAIRVNNLVKGRSPARPAGQQDGAGRNAP